MPNILKAEIRLAEGFKRKFQAYAFYSDGAEGPVGGIYNTSADARDAVRKEHGQRFLVVNKSPERW